MFIKSGVSQSFPTQSPIHAVNSFCLSLSVYFMFFKVSCDVGLGITTLKNEDMISETKEHRFKVLWLGTHSHSHTQLRNLRVKLKPVELHTDGKSNPGYCVSDQTTDKTEN